MIDSRREVRRGLRILMRGDEALTALVPSASIFGQTVPVMPASPWINCGAASATPLTGACFDGQEITTSIHAWATDRSENGRVKETAEDFIDRITGAIGRALDRRRFALSDGTARIAVRNCNTILDRDPNHFHAIVNLRVRCMTA